MRARSVFLAALCASGARGIEDSLAFVQQRTTNHAGHMATQDPSQGVARLSSFITTVVSMVTGDALQDISLDQNPPMLKNSMDLKHGMILDVTVKDTAQGVTKRGTRLFSDKCKATDAKGSMSCLIPFGDTLDSTAANGYMFKADQGSTFNLKAKLEFAGPDAEKVNRMMPDIDYTIPLCSDEETSMLVSGNNVTVAPFQCGDGGIDLESMAAWGLTSWDSAFKDSGVVSTFEPFLPLKVLLDITMKQGDGTSIASLGIVSGVDKMT